MGADGIVARNCESYRPNVSATPVADPEMLETQLACFVLGKPEMRADRAAQGAQLGCALGNSPRTHLALTTPSNQVGGVRAPLGLSLEGEQHECTGTAD